MAPSVPRPLRFGMPPSAGLIASSPSLMRLGEVLSQAVGSEIRPVLPSSYQGLGNMMQLGELDVAWAPPFVAARLEAVGFQVLLQGVRKGSPTYRSALVAVHEAASLTWISGRRAVWVDKDSVSGYLLPVAFLKAKGFHLDKDLASQEFAGSFVAAIQRVLEGKADFTAVYAAPAGVEWKGNTALEEIAPGLASRFKIIAFTDEVPSSGLVASRQADAGTVSRVKTALEKLNHHPTDAGLVEQLFQVDSFAAAPKNGYRVLYRLALATL